MLALALGLRQGEALGIQWLDIDLGEGVLAIAGGAGHGPDTPTAVMARASRRSAGLLPRARPSQPRRGLDEVPRRSADSSACHRSSSSCSKLTASTRMKSTGMPAAPGAKPAGCSPRRPGEPINPRTDWSHWKYLLAGAGLRDSRLHDARHTAATVLLLLGVSQPAIMSIMGWSNPAMTQRYAHVVAPIRQEVAAQVGDLLWGPKALPPAN